MASVEHYDYIVVGAGTCGATLAGRLTQDPHVSVLLLEAGPPDTSLWIHLPIGYGKTMWNPTYNWCFETEPEPQMHARKLFWPRGKTLGGSSSINAMIYVRGQAEDYDHWVSLGNLGWGFADVLPYFKRAEANVRGASVYHGGSGPVPVSDIRPQNELIEAFIRGANELGVPRNEDFNGESQVGAGYYQLTTRRGWRCSSAQAYLKPAKRRPNLQIRTHARATQIIFEGRRAVGITYLHDGVYKTARCRAEVLLAAGSIQSPQLLQLSGVGPGELLQHFGIPLVHELPGVGENLQDHLQVRVNYECTKPITINDDLRTWYRRARIGLQWLLNRAGPLALGVSQGGCFMRALTGSNEKADDSSRDARPDIQFHVSTISADMSGGALHPFSGFTLSTCQLRPESRGYVRIQSPDPLQAPTMTANYLSTELDRQITVAGVMTTRAIAATQTMQAYIKREHRPGPEVDGYDAVLDYCRENGQTIFHPTGSAKMGRDAMAVVDARLRVHGVEGLRVVDCSIMPTLVSGNTNAAAYMIAEKAVDMIQQDHRSSS